jgi:hypothetical protein
LSFLAGRGTRRHARTARTSIRGFGLPSREAPNTGSRCVILGQRTPCKPQERRTTDCRSTATSARHHPTATCNGRRCAHFGENYYTCQFLLDLKVGREWAVRTEPHPRFYIDMTDTVLIAVPTLLHTKWWPIISFVVFKSSPEGHTHTLRPGEPMLQILVLPVQAEFDLVQMDEGRRRNARCAAVAFMPAV